MVPLDVKDPEQSIPLLEKFVSQTPAPELSGEDDEAGEI